jgi:hypothetical protein
VPTPAKHVSIQSGDLCSFAHCVLMLFWLPFSLYFSKGREWGWPLFSTSHPPVICSWMRKAWWA